MNKKRLLVIAAIAAIAIAAAAFIFIRYSPGTDWEDYETYYGAGADETIVYVNGVLQEETALTYGGELYISYSLARSFDSKWYYSDEGLLLYTLADQTVSAAEGETAYSMDGSVYELGQELITIYNDTVYISVDYIEALTGIYVSEHAGDEESGLCGRLYIINDWGTYTQAAVKTGTQVRVLAGIKSEILTVAAEGDTVFVVDTVDEWTRVRTQDGFIGYVKTKCLTDIAEIELAASVSLPEYTASLYSGTVCMVWHQVFSESDNSELSELLSETSGINVVSPTWFSVTDNDGNISSLADADYVTTAHSLGLEVWALVDDFDDGIDTETLLSSSAARANLIGQLMQAVLDYDLDGINIDFESITEAGAIHFLQFIRELSVQLRAAGKTLSVDNYVPSGGRSWYDLAAQAETVDYIVIMGYDEHYKGCCSGTNASISFCEQAIADSLEDVPAEKLIDGIPFFVRVWQETPAENADEDATLYDDGNSVYDGLYARDSTAVSMLKAAALLEEHGAELTWDEELGQYYGEYEEDGSTYRIWLEDVRSVTLKIQKVAEYGIAGAAFWKLGLEDPDVWDVISSTLFG